MTSPSGFFFTAVQIAGAHWLADAYYRLECSMMYLEQTGRSRCVEPFQSYGYAMLTRNQFETQAGSDCSQLYDQKGSCIDQRLIKDSKS